MSLNQKNKNIYRKNFKLSIVIATVGEETLNKLIKQIKSSTFIPDEIIIVFPTVDMVKNITLKPKDILIFRSPKSGQVAQRYYGISKAKNKYILQLDADIEIKKDTIEQLIKSYIINGPKIAVGPKIDYLNKNKINKKNKYRAWKFVFQIFGGGNINDTTVHFVNHRLPFGGVGESGIGSYHGKQTFETFSPSKGVVKRGNWLDLTIRYAPYTDKLKKLRTLLKWS